jgi:hypothetical protein
MIPARLGLGEGKDGGQEVAVTNLALRERERVIVVTLDQGSERVEFVLRKGSLRGQGSRSALDVGFEPQCLAQDGRTFGSVLLELGELFLVVVFEALELCLEMRVPAVENLAPAERVVDGVQVLRVRANRSDDPQTGVEGIVIVADSSDCFRRPFLEDVEEPVLLQALFLEGLL